LAAGPASLDSTLLIEQPCPNSLWRIEESVPVTLLVLRHLVHIKCPRLHGGPERVQIV